MTALKIRLLDTQDHPLLEILNDHFQLEIVDELSQKEGLILSEEGLRYIAKDAKEVDFNWSKQWNYHVSKKYSLKKELLAKALGISKAKTKSVWDATCGTGKDMLLMLAYGLDVTAFERKAEVAALIFAAQYEAQKNENLSKKLSNHFQFSYGQLIDYVNKNIGEWPDAIYFDPMFTDQGRKKKALSRKEMEIFKDVVGDDEDSADYLESLLKLPVKRVVVKRHPGSPFLKDGVDASFEGKAVRYDLYINHKLSS